MIKYARIRPIVRKEFRQIVRDKRSLGVLLVVPAFMLIMFGYALNYDVKNVPLAVLDEDHTSTSREYADQFTHSEYFTRVAVLTSRHQIDSMIDRVIAHVVLIIPKNFGDDLHGNRSPSVQVLVDGANSTIAGTAVGYLSAISQNYSNTISLQALARAGIGRPQLPIDYRPRIWYNPELKSAKFLIPGLIGFILMITTVISTALSVVKEREKGTMEQITVSPIHPLELLIGKTLPYVLISLISTFIILVTGYLLFDVSVHGSYLLLFAVNLIFIIAGLSVGLWISTIAKTQEAAFMLSVTLTMLPTMTLSGFSFPIRNMPKPLQYLTLVNPARYFLEALRGIILKGVGLNVVWSQCLILIIFAAFISTVSWNKMRKEKL